MTALQLIAVAILTLVFSWLFLTRPFVNLFKSIRVIWVLVFHSLVTVAVTILFYTFIRGG